MEVNKILTKKTSIFVNIFLFFIMDRCTRKEEKETVGGRGIDSKEQWLVAMVFFGVKRSLLDNLKQHYDPICIQHTLIR